jgi:hypothetical protein
MYIDVVSYALTSGHLLEKLIPKCFMEYSVNFTPMYFLWSMCFCCSVAPTRHCGVAVGFSATLAAVLRVVLMAPTWIPGLDYGNDWNEHRLPERRLHDDLV